MDISIPDSVLKRALAIALEETSAGMLAGHRVATVVGTRPNNEPVLIRGVTVTIVPEEQEPRGLRIVALNGARI